MNEGFIKAKYVLYHIHIDWLFISSYTYNADTVLLLLLYIKFFC